MSQKFHFITLQMLHTFIINIIQAECNFWQYNTWLVISFSMKPTSGSKLYHETFLSQNSLEVTWWSPLSHIFGYSIQRPCITAIASHYFKVQISENLFLLRVSNKTKQLYNIIHSCVGLTLVYWHFSGTCCFHHDRHTLMLETS